MLNSKLKTKDSKLKVDMACAKHPDRYAAVSQPNRCYECWLGAEEFKSRKFPANYYKPGGAGYLG